MRKTTLFITLTALFLAPAMTPATPGQPSPVSNMERAVAKAHGIDRVKVDAFIVASSNKALIRYAGFSPKVQRRLAFLARRIAKFRGTALKDLIQLDPERALMLSLTPGQRQGLPKFVLNLLESHLHVKGDLIQAITEVAPGPDSKGESQQALPTPITSWTVRIGEETRQAFVYGLHQQHQTKFDLPIHGIALGELMAIDESPLYQYDLFETVQLGFKPDQIVATSGGLPIPLPDIEALFDLRQDLIEQILRFGPVPFPFNPHQWTTGIKRVLVFKVSYRFDDREAPYSDAEIAAWFGGVNQFFQQNSQHRTSFDVTIISTPFEVLPADNFTRAGPGVGHEILTDVAQRTARAFGTNPDDYDRVVILAPQLFDRPMARAAIGGKVVTVTGEKPDLRVTLAHELGHTYGFSHSSLWSTLGTDPLGPGVPQEYGDMWDMMGAANDAATEANPQRRHFNAFFKTLAGWLPTAAVVDGTLGGDFRLRAHDAVDAPGTRAIFVEAGDGSTYWLGRRGQFPANTSMANGIEVRRVSNYPSPAYGPVELLDLDKGWTPGPPLGQTIFHSLAELNTFTDTVNGITIRLVFVGDDDLGRFARVFITR